MASIDFIIFLTKYSNPYADFLIKTGESLKSGKHEICWKCVLSNDANVVPEKYECINEVNFKSSNASLRHGLTINSILPKISNDYVIISDVDIAITYKNWDEEIVNMLDGGYSCFGTKNIRREREPLNFPNIPFFCFKKNIMSNVNLNFIPIMKGRDIKRYIIEDEEEAEFRGRKVGDMIIMNTGSQLYDAFKKNGMKGFVLNPVLINSENVQLKFDDLKYRDKLLDNKKISKRNLVEFHYDGNVFLSHLGRSHKRSFKVGYIKNWSDRIKLYLYSKYNIEI